MAFESMWKFSPGLLFGQMYEDVEIERQAFRPGSRVFCIASAGCTAMALARDHQVTAVDINATQVEYARSRAQGGPAKIGKLDWMAQMQVRALVVAGWTRARLETFRAFDDCSEQLGFWNSQLNTKRFRALTDMKLGVDAQVIWLALRDKRMRMLNLGQVVRRRLERSLARHANHSNPYAQRLFGGTFAPPARVAEGNPIRFETADAVAFLNAAPSGSYDAFALSNIADLAAPVFREKLLSAVRHAAAPNAMVVLRTIAEPETGEEAEFAARDRGMVWGSVQVVPVEELR